MAFHRFHIFKVKDSHVFINEKKNYVLKISVSVDPVDPVAHSRVDAFQVCLKS